MGIILDSFKSKTSIKNVKMSTGGKFSLDILFSNIDSLPGSRTNTRTCVILYFYVKKSKISARKKIAEVSFTVDKSERFSGTSIICKNEYKNVINDEFIDEFLMTISNGKDPLDSIF